jgi:hypothetical protein
MPDVLEVWLATPDAADLFDPSALNSADHAAWTAIRTTRRRRDWESSRALLGAVPDLGDRRRSLSHSHGYAAIALAPATTAVGVDLEWMMPRNFNGMASVAFSPSECGYLCSLEDPSKLQSAFYEFWTLKEAFAKALRLPLVDALRHCCMIDAAGAHRAEVPTADHWRAIVFAPRAQLRLAVVRVNERPGSVHGPLDTIEWPSDRTGEWPIVMHLEGGGGRGPGAW